MTVDIFTQEDIDYTPCHCGGHCELYSADSDEPCWGWVEAVDEVEVDDDWDWVHACIGHYRVVDTVSPYCDGKYRPKPAPGDPFTDDYLGF